MDWWGMRGLPKGIGRLRQRMGWVAMLIKSPEGIANSLKAAARPGVGWPMT